MSPEMPLNPGSALGPYEVVALIGSGGMGEVYRAHDSRLGRDVAIKILPESFASDVERVRRFEQEGRAAGALNHPHIVSVYDVRLDGPSPYVVSELLEGQTLRQRVSEGALPVRKATEYASQLAAGLAAAHDKGITHRDLKPENLFVTSDGRLKILDFGLARVRTPALGPTQQMNAPTMAADTQPGAVLGTVGYMAPEQVRGDEADHRSDIFAFGAIVYEMLTGARAFQRDSAAESMTAILREDPPEISRVGGSVPPALERIVQRCLEKNPTERFQSARDLGFSLDALSSLSESSSVAVGPRQERVWNRVAWPGVVAITVAAAVAGWLVASGVVADPTPPEFRQLTFRRGVVSSARFAPDGQVIFSAAWDGIRSGQTPIEVVRLDLRTGERTPWRTLTAPDAAGVVEMGGVLFSDDLGAYVYGYSKRLSELYLVDGLR